MSHEVSTEVKGKELAAGILPKLFADINFNELNSTIEALAKNSDKLDDTQRSDAIDIVENWNRSVVNRLDNHASEIESFVTFITNRNPDFRGYQSDPVSTFGEDKLQNLAKSTGTSDLLTKYLEARDHYDDTLAMAPVEIRYADDPDLTLAEIQTREIEQMKEKKLYQLQLQRARVTEISSLREWLKELNKNEGIREMVCKGRRYRQQVKNFNEECKIKTQAAKLNLSIPNTDIRKALTDLIEFSSKI